MVSVILPNDGLRAQLPQAGIMVRTSRDEIGRVRTESAVPHPALVPLQRGLEPVRLVPEQRPAGRSDDVSVLLRRAAAAAAAVLELLAAKRLEHLLLEVVEGCLRGALGDGLVVVFLGRVEGPDLPDLGCVVGGAGGELADVWGQKDARYVRGVGGEVCDGEQLGGFIVLDQLPDKNVSLDRWIRVSKAPAEQKENRACRSGTYCVVGCAKKAAITSDGNARDADVLLRDEFVRAAILGEVPNPHAPAAVARDDLTLVRVDDDIVGRKVVAVGALDGAAARLPDLDGAVLGARDHPLALAVEGHARDVARVALKLQHGVRVRRLDVVELHRVVARGGEVALIRRDAEAVDLRLGVLDGAGADARESLPEAVDGREVGQKAGLSDGGWAGGEMATELA
jgi:hypothetical protein